MEKPKRKIMGIEVKIIGANTYFNWMVIFGTSPNRRSFLEQEGEMTHIWIDKERLLNKN